MHRYARLMPETCLLTGAVCLVGKQSGLSVYNRGCLQFFFPFKLFPKILVGIRFHRDWDREATRGRQKNTQAVILAYQSDEICIGRSIRADSELDVGETRGAKKGCAVARHAPPE